MLKCTLHTLKKHLPKYYIHVQHYIMPYELDGVP